MQAKTWFGCLLTVTLAACGGGKGGDADDPASKQRDLEDEVTDQEIAEVMADGSSFDEGFGERILKRGARKAEQCNRAGASVGEGEIKVVFDGTKGRVVDVELGWEFEQGSDDGKACIKNAFIGEIIPPFEGNRTVPYTIDIPPLTEGETKDEGK